MKCNICGHEHNDIKCPYIKAYEYYPILDAQGHAIVKRVEFVTIADFYEADTDITLPDHATVQ